MGTRKRRRRHSPENWIPASSSQKRGVPVYGISLQLATLSRVIRASGGGRRVSYAAPTELIPLWGADSIDMSALWTCGGCWPWRGWWLAPGAPSGKRLSRLRAVAKNHFRLSSSSSSSSSSAELEEDYEEEDEDDAAMTYDNRSKGGSGALPFRRQTIPPCGTTSPQARSRNSGAPPLKSAAAPA
jgi:hypothetical protein